MGTRVRAISVLVALAVVLTSAQCVTACVVAECQSHSTVPPCHREQHHRNTQRVPLACSHELATVRTADVYAQISHSDLSTAVSAMGVLLPVPVGAAGCRVTRQDASPPGLTSLSAVVLRI
jgi:hypothetical protein